MPAWLIVLITLAVLFFLLPPLFARLPRSKHGGGGFGNALQELNALFNPGERHVQEAAGDPAGGARERRAEGLTPLPLRESEGPSAAWEGEGTARLRLQGLLQTSR